MLGVEPPQITAEELNDQLGVFVIEPLDPGFGYTFGASLRRVMLSSLAGAAITSVRIEGVEHEFTTIPGIKEDVTDIVLNLKGLACRLHGDSPVEVSLHVKDPREVTAADFELPANVEIINPELHIASLEGKAELELTVTIAPGRGYVPAVENKDPEAPIGVIPIDSLFSPVKRVAYQVESARVGQRTDFDKLILEVETNGAIDPRRALAEAAEIVVTNMGIFISQERLDAITPVGGTPHPESGEESGADNQLSGIPIEELELGVRAYNGLRSAGINTLGDLLAYSESEISAIPNLGKKSIDEILENLANRELTLRA